MRPGDVAGSRWELYFVCFYREDLWEASERGVPPAAHAVGRPWTGVEEPGTSRRALDRVILLLVVVSGALLLKGWLGSRRAD